MNLYLQYPTHKHSPSKELQKAELGIRFETDIAGIGRHMYFISVQYRSIPVLDWFPPYSNIGLVLVLAFFYFGT
jgi:hypothetical protein